MSYLPGQATPSNLPNLIRYLFRELQRVGQEFYAISPQAWTDVTFAANWETKTTATYNTSQYRISNGYVELRGRAGSSGAGNLDDVIFTLPETHRPKKEVQFPAASNNAFGKLRVLSDGGVILQIGNVAWVQLDGIRFSLD